MSLSREANPRRLIMDFLPNRIPSSSSENSCISNNYNILRALFHTYVFESSRGIQQEPRYRGKLRKLIPGWEKKPPTAELVLSPILDLDVSATLQFITPFTPT